MLLKMITPFDIIEDGINATHYDQGDSVECSNEETIAVALRAGWAEKIAPVKTTWISPLPA